MSGAKGLAQNGAGWVAGKAGNVISTVANSGVGQAIGGAAGKVGGVAKGVVSVGSNALGALGNFAGAGAGLLGSVWGPVAGGFGSLFAGAAPVIAAISGIIAVVSILGDHLEDIRGIVVNVFGETGGQVFDVFTGKLQGVADFVTGLFSEGGVAAALAPLAEHDHKPVWRERRRSLWRRGDYTAIHHGCGWTDRDLCNGHGQADHTGCIYLYHGYGAAHYFADLYGGSADDSQHNFQYWQCGYDGYADHWQRHSGGNAYHTGHYYRDYDHWQRGCARTTGRV